MDEVQAKILSILDANGGRTSWDTVKAGLDYKETQLLPKAIKNLKSAGVAQAQNRAILGPDGNVLSVAFEVFRLPVGGN